MYTSVIRKDLLLYCNVSKRFIKFIYNISLHWKMNFNISFETEKNENCTQYQQHRYGCLNKSVKSRKMKRKFIFCIHIRIRNGEYVKMGKCLYRKRYVCLKTKLNFHIITICFFPLWILICFGMVALKIKEQNGGDRVRNFICKYFLWSFFCLQFPIHCECEMMVLMWCTHLFIYLEIAASDVWSCPCVISARFQYQKKSAGSTIVMKSTRECCYRFLFLTPTECRIINLLVEGYRRHCWRVSSVCCCWKCR